MAKRQASMLNFCQIDSKRKKRDEYEEESEVTDERVFRINEELEHGTADEGSSDSEGVGTDPQPNPDCDQPCVLTCCGNETVAYQPTD